MATNGKTCTMSIILQQKIDIVKSLYNIDIKSLLHNNDNVDSLINNIDIDIRMPETGQFCWDVDCISYIKYEVFLVLTVPFVLLQNFDNVFVECISNSLGSYFN